MNLEFIPTLADAIKYYYEDRELEDLCSAFSVAVDRGAYMALARKLITEVDFANNRRLLGVLVASLINRANKCVVDTVYVPQQLFHEKMVEGLHSIESALLEAGIPEEVTVPESRPFTAKSHAREFLGKAETILTVVDNYVGLGTLDCLRDVSQPIRLLTGNHDQAIENGFSRALAAFRTEGFSVEVRRHPRLHDRYILFNDRSWLVGSSLKDAGKKQLNIIECVDTKAAIVHEVERKWSEAEVFQA